MFSSFGVLGKSACYYSQSNNHDNNAVHNNEQNNHNITNTDDCFDSPFKDFLLSIFWFLAR